VECSEMERSQVERMSASSFVVVPVNTRRRTRVKAVRRAGLSWPPNTWCAGTAAAVTAVTAALVTAAAVDAAVAFVVCGRSPIPLPLGRAGWLVRR
jgi:hypothetical protein